MVFCIIGLVIFAVLGLFSTKYRRYFRESLHCMRRQLTLKACDTQFDQEMKSKISAAISKTSPRLARFVFRRFAILSWILLVIMIVSTVFVAYGFYNFAVYGNCNGPESKDFCIFNPFGTQSLKMIAVQSEPMLGNPDAPVKIVEVGCYACPYTRDAEAVRSQLLKKYGANLSFIFKDIPLPNHVLSWEEGEAAKCAQDQGMYWPYHDKLFQYQDQMTLEKLKGIALEIGLNTTEFNACVDSRKFKTHVEQDYNDGIAAGIKVTPTYFINGKPIEGLKAFADFEQIVVGEIRGSCPT